MNDNRPPAGRKALGVVPILGTVDAATGVGTLKRPILRRPGRPRPRLVE